MPRRQMSYMVPEPLEPLNLEEVKFWLRIMEEHALFIKSGLPCDQTEFIDEAQAFEQEFESLRLRAERVQNDKKFTELVNDTQTLVREFYSFKRKLLHMMLECKLGGYNFPLLLDHMAREAEYVIRLLDKNKNGKALVTGGTKAQETGFWLRIMADHAKFMSHLLDPSECNLITTANAFSEEFDNLFLQGRDFSSMLQGYSEVASFKRFIQDARAATLRLRDFKRAAEEMIEECRLVGLIPALLADHVRREADHFLMIMVMLEKGITKNMAMAAMEEDEDIIPIQDLHEPCKIFKVMKPEREKYDDEETEELLSDDELDIESMIQDKIDHKNKVHNESKQSISEVKSSIISEVDHTPEPPSSETKYKWSGKWPRQLGKKGE
ncbi:DUF2935 domain-containing protein [Pelosinus sp. sgz500959]|uniref:DUF2935 domain-containing protein n=1 Tax=Pelosinus sp. sgz500959 TaxID=3242472 RepID=UPI00366B3F20